MEGVTPPNPAVGSRWGSVKFSGINTPGLSVPLCPLPQRKWVHQQRGEARRGRRKRRRAEVGPSAPRAQVLEAGLKAETKGGRWRGAARGRREETSVRAAAEAAVAAAAGD